MELVQTKAMCYHCAICSILVMLMQENVARCVAELKEVAAAVQPALERRNVANSCIRQLTQAKVCALRHQ